MHQKNVKDGKDKTIIIDIFFFLNCDRLYSIMLFHPLQSQTLSNEKIMWCLSHTLYRAIHSVLAGKSR